MASEPPRVPEPTGELARRAHAGEAAPYAQLYARLAPALYAWASLRLPRTLRGFVSPEDIVQEVWCRTTERFATFDPTRGEFRSWLFGFAYRVLREALRSALRLQRERAPDGSRVFRLEDLPDDITSLTRRVARADDVRALLARIDELALEPDERELLLLRGLEGLPHEEIAAQLGIQPAAVRKRWERLRERLASVCGPLHDEAS
jgi:RNA polymerase sigma-70 factor (ECF subfamily)